MDDGEGSEVRYGHGYRWNREYRSVNASDKLASFSGPAMCGHCTVVS